MEELNGVVTQKIEVAPDLIVLQVTPRDWDLPEFEAGQFAVLGLPPQAPRATWSDQEDEITNPDRISVEPSIIYVPCWMGIADTLSILRSGNR